MYFSVINAGISNTIVDNDTCISTYIHATINSGINIKIYYITINILSVLMRNNEFFSHRAAREID